ncbi:MAG: hypothetical protein ABI628_02790 [Chloroflexota bacterium]
MTKAEGSTRSADPFETWRQLYEANERAWNASLEEAMNRPEFSVSSGKMLETMLAGQKAVRDNMRSFLESMNVPTREDIARLGELVVGLEEKIDQVADRMDSMEDAIVGLKPGSAAVEAKIGKVVDRLAALEGAIRAMKPGSAAVEAKIERVAPKSRPAPGKPPSAARKSRPAAAKSGSTRKTSGPAA